MAGSFINVDLQGFDQVNRILQQLATASTNLKPAMQEIGEYLLESHQQRFELEVEPDGTPWEPLQPKTVKRKGGDDRILKQSNILKDTLHYQADANTLLFGTNLEYGATHQFGREGDGIVARPFLGLATGPWEDSDEILAILQDHLQQAMHTN
ncbi:phage virion morphogenesis protein [Bowmanella denitrificans]|uniref:phage virion morphogenesis protein n=1 Tax=Bowmanella denitrificans TaxID=366582 RepID=UPI000C9AE01C|nr:phage virion morphogenesis protein [Bowmanella denitrificans]